MPAASGSIWSEFSFLDDGSTLSGEAERTARCRWPGPVARRRPSAPKKSRHSFAICWVGAGPTIF